MSNFKEGQKVATIRDCQLIEGTIQELFDFSDVAIVKFNDDSVEKVPLSVLCVVPEKEPVNKNEEPVIKTEITITSKEFMDLSVGLALKEIEENPMVGLAFSIFASKIHKALFFNEGANG